MENFASLIGINDYEDAPLIGCETDATELADVISRHADQSKNFHTEVHLSSKSSVLKGDILKAATKVFTVEDIGIALFYFSGHGTKTKHGSFLVPQDASEFDEGVPMANIVSLANESPANERIIVLDCCHSGSVDELFGSTMSIPVSLGVSILAACRSEQEALERNRRGVFTRHVCDALLGGAADVRGFVNVPSIYSYANEVLQISEQRPLLKTNVAKLVSLRRAPPAISDHALRKMIELFPSSSHKFQLDPSFEPTELPNHPENEATFGILQQYRAARLLVPNDEEHLYWAAMHHRTCSLTPLGQHYWQRVKADQI